MAYGLQTPSAVYEVFVEDPGSEAEEWLGEFDAGVNAYLAGDFVTAQERLARAQAINPKDTVAGVLAQRCRQLSLRPAGEWTGAWKLTEK